MHIPVIYGISSDTYSDGSDGRPNDVRAQHSDIGRLKQAYPQYRNAPNLK